MGDTLHTIEGTLIELSFEGILTEMGVRVRKINSSLKVFEYKTRDTKAYNSMLNKMDEWAKMGKISIIEW